MKQIIFSMLSLLSISVAGAQTEPAALQDFSKQAKEMKPKLGIKLGYNFAKVIGNTPNFSPKSNNGFMVSGFYSTKGKGMGYRTELVFSRQGFSFDDNGKMQDISQDYLYMPHLTTYTIAGKIQLHAGGQIGYLLNAKKTAENTETSEQVTSYINRIDYGFAGGIEVYPFKGLLVGGCYNVSLGNIYNTSSYSTSTPTPYPLPFNPDEVKGKNAVVQFFVGYRF